MSGATGSVSLHRPDLIPSSPRSAPRRWSASLSAIPTGLPPTRQAPQAACQTARPSSSRGPVTSPRCSKRRPPWWTCSPPSGPTPVRWSPVSVGATASAPHRPATWQRTLAGANSARPGKSARRDSRHAGAARRPGWRAPLLRQREDL